jgi:hypothetical protein
MQECKNARMQECKNAEVEGTGPVLQLSRFTAQQPLRNRKLASPANGLPTGCNLLTRLN